MAQLKKYTAPKRSQVVTGFKLNIFDLIVAVTRNFSYCAFPEPAAESGTKTPKGFKATVLLPIQWNGATQDSNLRSHSSNRVQCLKNKISGSVCLGR